MAGQKFAGSVGVILESLQPAVAEDHLELLVVSPHDSSSRLGLGGRSEQMLAVWGVV